MELLISFLILAAIIVIAKMLGRVIKVMDIVLYLVIGFVAVKLNFLDPHGKLLSEIAEIGVIFLMFAAGWDEDLLFFLKKVWENKWVALIAAIGPFIGAFLSMKFLGFSQTQSIVAGFIFLATAVPFTVLVLNSLKLNKTPAAKSILAAAMADDFLSIFSMSIVFSLFALMSGGAIEMTSSQVLLVGLKNLGLIILAFVTFMILGLIVFPEQRVSKKEEKEFSGVVKLATFIDSLPGFKSIHKFFYRTKITIPLTLVVLFSLAVFSEFMGLHAAIGAYLVGLILHEQFFFLPKEKDKKELSERSHHNLSVFIHQVANDWLGPVFFIYLGAQLVIETGNITNIIGLSFVVFLALVITQFISAMLAARHTTNLPWKDSVLVGMGMLPRDVLAFVVMGTAIQYGLIDGQSTFVTVIIITVLMLNIFAPFAMSWWSKYYNGEKSLKLFGIEFSK